MLILGRFKGQKIVINGDLIITITGYNEKRTGLEVLLGFEGDLNKYIIDREEIHEKKRNKHD